MRLRCVGYGNPQLLVPPCPTPTICTLRSQCTAVAASKSGDRILTKLMENIGSQIDDDEDID